MDQTEDWDCEYRDGRRDAFALQKLELVLQLVETLQQSVSLYLME